MLIDILALIAVGFGIYLGYKKGFVGSIFSALAWILGLFAALKLTALGTGLMRGWFHSQSPYIPLITFILIFIGVVVLVILFGKFVDKIISVAQLGIFNKLLGALMKGVIFLLLFSVLLWLFNEAGVVSPAVKSQSKLYGYVAPVAPGFFHFVDRNLPALSGLLDNLKKYFNQLNINATTDIQISGLKSPIEDAYPLTPPLRVGLLQSSPYMGFSPTKAREDVYPLTTPLKVWLVPFLPTIGFRPTKAREGIYPLTPPLKVELVQSLPTMGFSPTKVI